MIRVGTDNSAGARLVVDLYIRPGGAVAGEHIHPVIHERFSVLQGRVGFAIGGKKSVATPGQTLDVPPGFRPLLQVDTCIYQHSMAYKHLLEAE